MALAQRAYRTMCSDCVYTEIYEKENGKGLEINCKKPRGREGAGVPWRPFPQYTRKPIWAVACLEFKEK